VLATHASTYKEGYRIQRGVYDFLVALMATFPGIGKIISIDVYFRVARVGILIPLIHSLFLLSLSPGLHALFPVFFPWKMKKGLHFFPKIKFCLRGSVLWSRRCILWASQMLRCRRGTHASLSTQPSYPTPQADSELACPHRHRKIHVTYKINERCSLRSLLITILQLVQLN